MTASSRPPSVSATPPETLEGWYALHQIFSIDRQKFATLNEVRGRHEQRDVDSTQTSVAPGAGWSANVELIGSRGDLMVIHFRATLDGIADAQRSFDRQTIATVLRPIYSFLSVTEAGLYHLTAELARAATERGGTVGDEIYTAELARRASMERGSAHVQRRLFPAIPEGMRYVSFYPMAKRRTAEQNWYALSLDERSRLMHTHGMTGRRYAGRVMQIITGAIGFDAWEWGVTLFAKDPLDFKKLVTDMRFDEVSANYADFGDFYVGALAAGDLETAIETIVNGVP
jgi:hydrogen peroxide-dependent heme synthase